MTYFRQGRHLWRQSLEEDFPNFGFEDKERTHISHRELQIIYSGGWLCSGPKLDPERDNPLPEEKTHNSLCWIWPITVICWINVQLPSPLLGSQLAQGVRQTSLTSLTVWSNSHLSKDKRNRMVVRIYDNVCCSNEQLFHFHIFCNFSG